jgi:CRAL/TRIO, N-terminal domain
MISKESPDLSFNSLACTYSTPFYSFMGDMSEEQEKALEIFRKYIKDNNITDHPQYDDYYLLRFLRARKFDMDKTILMFTNFMDWRKENDVDNILDVRNLN